MARPSRRCTCAAGWAWLWREMPPGRDRHKCRPTSCAVCARSALGFQPIPRKIALDMSCSGPGLLHSGDRIAHRAWLPADAAAVHMSFTFRFGAMAHFLSVILLRR